MQKAKQAVENFISHDGKHKTTVDETVNAPVTNEHIMPTKHENVTTAVDKEIHQHHVHTNIQPLKAKEVLPEQHTHNQLPTQHKEFHHGSQDEHHTIAAREAAKFKDQSVTHETHHTSSTAPVVTGERTHHHVHEHIQPVIEKETIAPTVVHTTVPIHETHHAEAVHHGTSVLPTKTIDEFRSSGGVLEGRGAGTIGEYDGCPRSYDKSRQTETLGGDKDFHLHSKANELGHDHSSHSHTHTTGTGAGVSAAAAGVGAGTHSHNTTGTHTTGTHNPAIGQENTHSTTTGKPSLLDKINPFKDADHDGKKGLMD